jgi:NAD(P)-dependent dehydrogenase (short-subunit alcohol dehydrogenase family)
MKKAIIITGAAGGLGKATVKECLKAFPEYTIIVTDIHPDISTYTDDRLIGLQMDVTDEDSIRFVRDEVMNRGLKVWGLVNNAGISDFFPITETGKKDLEKIYSINTFGPVNMVRTFLPHLIETKGRVVNISSESVRLPAAFHPYANTKIALEALSNSMRQELALSGVKLSIIRPGAINTAFLDDLHDLKDRIGEGIYTEYLHNFASKAPKQIHRIVEPEKVASVIIKALLANKPRRFYRVNNNPMLRIAQFFPHWMRDYFMLKMLK